MENAQDNIKYKFGLLGRDISYSFSRGYFAEKFKNENLPHSYVNFDLQTIDELKPIIENTSNLKGINVTIPYKELYGQSSTVQFSDPHGSILLSSYVI